MYWPVIMATLAPIHTRICVRKPAACPFAPLSSPMIPPQMTHRTSFNAISELSVPRKAPHNNPSNEKFSLSFLSDVIRSCGLYD